MGSETKATSMMTTDDLRERVSRLEGGYEHLATKADIAKLEGRMEARFAEMEARFSQMQTLIAHQENRLFLKFGGLVIATVGVAVAVLRLFG